MLSADHYENDTQPQELFNPDNLCFPYFPRMQSIL